MTIAPSEADDVITALRKISDSLDALNDLMAAQTAANQEQIARIAKLSNKSDRAVDNEVPPIP